MCPVSLRGRWIWVRICCYNVLSPAVVPYTDYASRASVHVVAGSASQVVYNNVVHALCVETCLNGGVSTESLNMYRRTVVEPWLARWEEVVAAEKSILSFSTTFFFGFGFFCLHTKNIATIIFGMANNKF